MQMYNDKKCGVVPLKKQSRFESENGVKVSVDIYNSYCCYTVF